MSDLISRKELIEFLDGQIKDVTETKPTSIFTVDVLKAMRTTGEAVKRYVNQLPTAYDVDKVKTPKKVYHFLEDDTFETTCCGTDVTNMDYNFCPNCGCELGKVEEVGEEGAVEDE